MFFSRRFNIVGELENIVCTFFPDIFFLIRKLDMNTMNAVGGSTSTSEAVVQRDHIVTKTRLKHV